MCVLVGVAVYLLDMLLCPLLFTNFTRSPYLNQNALEVRVLPEDHGAHFDDEISQLVSLSFAFDFDVFLRRVESPKFLHDEIEWGVCDKAGACVQYGKA